jgi:hypothetical protein
MGVPKRLRRSNPSGDRLAFGAWYRGEVIANIRFNPLSNRISRERLSGAQHRPLEADSAAGPYLTKLGPREQDRARIGVEGCLTRFRNLFTT